MCLYLGCFAVSIYVLHGLGPWLIQRISAVYITLFFIYVGYTLATASEIGYRQWYDWLSHPLNTIATGLFVIALLLHAWVGVRDIVLDYVHNTLVRMTAFTLVIVVLIASGIWCAKILLLTVSL